MNKSHVCTCNENMLLGAFMSHLELQNIGINTVETYKYIAS